MSTEKHIIDNLYVKNNLIGVLTNNIVLDFLAYIIKYQTCSPWIP